MKESTSVKLLATMLLMVSSTIVLANPTPVEVWECKDVNGSWESILVTTTVEKGRKKGRISVAGVTHSTAFEVQGFDRRWDFGLLSNNTYRYAFIIQPNGYASYTDFMVLDGKKGATPRYFMYCRQISISPSNE